VEKRTHIVNSLSYRNNAALNVTADYSTIQSIKTERANHTVEVL
jgi:hypothetical protein